jgi:hypothetical protein
MDYKLSQEQLDTLLDALVSNHSTPYVQQKAGRDEAVYYLKFSKYCCPFFHARDPNDEVRGLWAHLLAKTASNHFQIYWFSQAAASMIYSILRERPDLVG